MKVPRSNSAIRTIIIKVSADLHRALRIRVATDDISMQHFILPLIERELSKDANHIDPPFGNPPAQPPTPENP